VVRAHVREFWGSGTDERLLHQARTGDDAMTTLEKKLAQAIMEVIDEVVKTQPRLKGRLDKVRSLLQEAGE
jgi:hypothetical protein